MMYWSRLWQIACHLHLPSVFKKRSFLWFKGWKISFGVWIRITVDTPGAPPSLKLAGEQLYQYAPLDARFSQFRLLKIHPGKPDDPLETELLTVGLPEAPPFEALSYAWGPSALKNFISINVDRQCVPPGAFNAIHTLRRPDLERLVWVDAVCINQHDISERNYQVSMMRTIYQSAKAVVVYLGHPTERTAEGMRTLRSFTTDEADEHPTWSNTSLSDVERNLVDILTRPWFTRVWTVQEAVLAQHTILVCGEHEVFWNGDYRTIRKILFRLKSTIISPDFFLARERVSTLDWRPLLNVLETQMRHAARKEGLILLRNHLDLAFDFRDRQSHDPRDKYFAMLGIIENEQGGELRFGVDYNLGLEEVHYWFVNAIRDSEENDCIGA